MNPRCESLSSAASSDSDEIRTGTAFTGRGHHVHLQRHMPCINQAMPSGYRNIYSVEVGHSYTGCIHSCIYICIGTTKDAEHLGVHLLLLFFVTTKHETLTSYQ